jgi:DNA polymerase III subunit epsilon
MTDNFMPLNTTKPIVFFDLETTGVEIGRDRIVQIGAIKLMPDGAKTEYNWLVNPGMPIPKVTTDIHGITDEMVKDKPMLGEMTKELTDLFFEVDLGGYNVRNFDIPFLMAELARVGIEFDTENARIVDGMAIFRTMEPRNLTAAYKKYTGKELVDAHDALVDIKATLEVVEGQISYYDDIGNTPDKLHELCFPPDPEAYDAEGKLRYVDGQLCITFGKNRGKTLQFLAKNDPGYLEWILNGGFSKKVKDAIGEVLK